MPSMHLSQLRRWLLQSPPAEWAIMRLRELLIGAVRQGPVPHHIAFVMDGNRRFARQQGIEIVEGHNQGFEALAKILEVCYKSGVRVVTIYAFSIENFKRSKYEVDALMDMAKVKLAQLCQHGDLLERYGARIRILGQRDLIKPDVLEAMDRAVNMTKSHGDAILNICCPYTSHAEITTAIRDTVVEYSQPLPSPQRSFSESHIAHNIRARRLSNLSTPTRLSSTLQEAPPSESHSPPNSISTSTSDTEPDLSSQPHSLSSSTTTFNHTLHPSTPPPTKSEGPSPSYPDPETITPQTLTGHMYTASLPPLDLLIRTSGVERLSDFMLWQAHEDTQIVFLSCLWPEFDLWRFLPVLVEWQWRRRNVSKPSQRSGGAASVTTAAKAGEEKIEAKKVV